MSSSRANFYSKLIFLVVPSSIALLSAIIITLQPNTCVNGRLKFTPRPNQTCTLDYSIYQYSTDVCTSAMMDIIRKQWLACNTPVNSALVVENVRVCYAYLVPNTIDLNQMFAPWMLAIVLFICSFIWLLGCGSCMLRQSHGHAHAQEQGQGYGREHRQVHVQQSRPVNAIPIIVTETETKGSIALASTEHKGPWIIVHNPS